MQHLLTYLRVLENISSFNNFVLWHDISLNNLIFWQDISDNNFMGFFVLFFGMIYLIPTCASAEYI